MGFLNIIGDVDKAILCIRDYNAIEPAKDDSASAQSILGTAMGAVNKVQSTVKKAADRMSSLSAMLGDGPQYSVDGYIPMEVQYNPSSIRLYTTGKGSGGYQIGSNNVTQSAQLISQTNMDFELIFEDINNQDAFDISSMGVNVETIYDMTKNIAGGPFSVINQVQGLLGLIHNAALQEMIFLWGDMGFKGNLTDVSVEYTMFNKDGNPIYAKVKMSMQHIYDEKDKEDQKYWDNVIKNVFKRNEYLESYR